MLEQRSFHFSPELPELLGGRPVAGTHQLEAVESYHVVTKRPDLFQILIPAGNLKHVVQAPGIVIGKQAIFQIV